MQVYRLRRGWFEQGGAKVRQEIGRDPIAEWPRKNPSSTEPYHVVKEDATVIHPLIAEIPQVKPARKTGHALITDDPLAWLRD